MQLFIGVPYHVCGAPSSQRPRDALENSIVCFLVYVSASVLRLPTLRYQDRRYHCCGVFFLFPTRPCFILPIILFHAWLIIVDITQRCPLRLGAEGGGRQVDKRLRACRQVAESPRVRNFQRESSEIGSASLVRGGAIFLRDCTSDGPKVVDGTARDMRVDCLLDVLEDFKCGACSFAAAALLVVGSQDMEHENRLR